MRSFGPSVALMVLSVVVYSVATDAALDGIPNTETGLFAAMAEVVGIDRPGITVVSPTMLWVARIAGIGILLGLLGVGLTRRRLNRSRARA